MSDAVEAESSPERLVLFTDAVAAIAITLLILPLLETVTAAGEEDLPLPELLRADRAEFAGFLLSFAVIFRFWWAHHRVFRHVTRLRPPIVLLSALWTLAIVLLPVLTSVITTYPPSPTTVALYVGTLVLSSGSLTALTAYVMKHPEVSAGRNPATREALLGNATVFVALLLAAIIGSVFADAINYWAILLMLLGGPVERLIKSRWRAQSR
ncbi:TMEM175 family protein [Paractinoplanes atraurantiacus]|uniref:Uncharacterized membrane protein n=1 Tax=Paractinoplanes atraurantiacus TaxID=1036182 RepID=A0A285JQV8_9ACTN|nr:TMEM175 family protein [Actinoplanes atraurantiacus]SNY62157.1 Uncharacterized membrane protein [Actinoplanes atraurantiacus]